MCGFDVETKTIETPSLGIKLGHLLNKISYILKGESIIFSNNEVRIRAEYFSTLVSMRWNDEISKVSRTELETRKWNKPQLLPLTEDLKAMKDHLIAVRREAAIKLASSNSDVRAWRDLCTSTLAGLILLNRRRSGEASKICLKDITSIPDPAAPNGKVKKSLSPFEQELCKTLN